MSDGSDSVTPFSMSMSIYGDTCKTNAYSNDIHFMEVGSDPTRKCFVKVINTKTSSLCLI